MANPIQQAGGASEPTSFAPLHTNRIFTGLWSNRSPLRDAAVSGDMEQYGFGRQDSIIAGQNSEISTRLTLIRRPGNSVYNSQIFPPIKRFFPFNTFTLTSETIRVIADTAATVYDATGPNTKNVIWQKSPGAQDTFFLGVGNTLYFTNGVDNKQWTVPPNWEPNTTYYVGNTVLDSNGDVQEAVGFDWVPISNVAVASSIGGNSATFNTSAAVSFLGQPMQVVASSVPGLNYTPFNASWSSATTLFWAGVPSSVPLMGATNVGGFLASVRSTGGVSGGAAPPWQEGGGVTGDGEVIWHNRGPNVVDWGIAAPLNAPTITQSAVANPFLAWLANTAVGGFWRGAIIIYDPNTGSSQTCTEYGTTGGSAPAFSGSYGVGVVDGSTAWRSGGTTNWQANHNYAFEDVVMANVSTTTGAQAMMFTVYSEGTTGLSGASAPAFQSGVGSFTTDGSITWINVGNQHLWSDIGPNTLCWPGTPNVSGANYFTILDPNGYTQVVGQSGKTGVSAPSFNTSQGGQTTDGSVIWINSGPFAVAATLPAQYGYAFKNSVTGDISNMSPATAQILLQADSQAVVQGLGSTDEQVDTIVIYRTVQGGSTFLELAEIPAPAGGGSWSYTDTTPDSGLNVTIQAQVNGEGTPLPRGASCMAYHLQRIFVAVGNVVYVSSGPDAIVSTSSGNAGFITTFTAQSKVKYLWVSSLGLVVFTTRDTYIILGSAKSDDPLYMTTFLDGMPLGGYDAFTTHLTTPYLMTTTNMVLALDPSAGITEASFPIADVIEEDFDPTQSYVTFHVESSKDHALYVADGATGWYRMAATSAPESGFGWSTKANLIGTHSAVQSVEVSPGTFRLLIGPGPAGGPIWFRDKNAWTDAGTPYPANTTFGSIVLAQPGQLAGLAFFTLESLLIGSKPALSVLMGEIAGTFEPLNRTRQDPTNLPPSVSLYSDRYHFMQNQTPVWCRHFQMDIAWPAEDAANELLTFTVFGQTWNEYRSQ